MDNQLCLVCAEHGASRHYGSVCCSGCKGFFRRTVRFKRKYECSFDKKCVIHKEFRNCCRACRYDKCLQVGLNPLMVHSDRVAQGKSEGDEENLVVVKQEVYSSEDFNESGGSEVAGSSSVKSNLIVAKKEIVDSFDDEISHWHNLILTSSKRLCETNSRALGSARIIPTLDQLDFNSVSQYFVLVEKLVDDFYETDKNHVFAKADEHFYSLNVPVEKAFREPREMSHRSKIDWRARYFLKSCSLNKAWCRIMSHYVDWASHIPELTKMTQEDQLQMMISRSIPCVWIMISYRAITYNINGVPLSGGSYFPRDEKDQDGVDRDIYPFLKRMCDWVSDEFIDPAREMDMSHEEYAILRLVLFFMPVSTLSPGGKVMVRQARNFYRNVLVQIVRSRFKNWDHIRIADRVSQLMCFLPIMETAGRFEDESLSVMTLFNVADMQGELTYEIHVRKSQ